MSIETPTIREQVATLKQATSPTKEGEVFARENAATVSRGLPPGVAVAGDRFPSGVLLTPHGETTTVREAFAGKPSVVIFYRGAWCPYCNIALRAYEETLTSPLRDLGVELVAISPQKPDGSMTMKEKNELRYSVLSDPGNEIARQLGVLHELSAMEVAAQRSLGLDVQEVNADGSTVLSFPTTCLVNADGRIEWIDVHIDYTSRTEASEILAAVESFLERTPAAVTTQTTAAE